LIGTFCCLFKFLRPVSLSTDHQRGTSLTTKKAKKQDVISVPRCSPRRLLYSGQKIDSPELQSAVSSWETTESSRPFIMPIETEHGLGKLARDFTGFDTIHPQPLTHTQRVYTKATDATQIRRLLYFRILSPMIDPGQNAKPHLVIRTSPPRRSLSHMVISSERKLITRNHKTKDKQQEMRSV